MILFLLVDAPVLCSFESVFTFNDSLRYIRTSLGEVSFRKTVSPSRFRRRVIPPQLAPEERYPLSSPCLGLPPLSFPLLQRHNNAVLHEGKQARGPPLSPDKYCRDDYMDLSQRPPRFTTPPMRKGSRTFIHIYSAQKGCQAKFSPQILLPDIHPPPPPNLRLPSASRKESQCPTHPHSFSYRLFQFRYM